MLARPVERGVKGDALLRQSGYIHALSQQDRVKTGLGNTAKGFGELNLRSKRIVTEIRPEEKTEFQKADIC